MPTRRPSVRSANWLYLLTLVLILTLGSYFQSVSLGWGLLFTEVGLILLPTLIFLRLGRQPVGAVLRLRWPGARLVLLGAVIGAGVWGLDIGLQGLLTALLGYAPRSALTTLAADPLNLAVFVTAMALAAPLCEEVLFRGYMLSAYSRYRPPVALMAVGLLFAFYHLQFSGLVALLPIALLLGVLAQRANALAPSIAAHLANNALGATVAVLARLNPVLTNSSGFTVVLCGLMVAGPVVALVGLGLYVRLTRPTAAAPAAPHVPAAPAPLGRGAFWPLGGAAVLYVLVAGLEVLLGRFPQVLAARTLQLDPAPWAQPTHLVYNLWNVANEQVGTVNCRLTPQGAAVAFDCVSRQRAFEARLGQSFYAGGQYVLLQTGRWDAATMRLLDAQLAFEGEFSRWSADVVSVEGDGLSLTLPGVAPARLPADTVLLAEWPFRFMALPLGQSAYFGSRMNYALLGVGAETGVLTEAVVPIPVEEDLPLPPAGEVVRVWKVQVGEQTAWYAFEPPHTLLRYTDGLGVTWTIDLALLDLLTP